jgi:hypothetical protein
VVFRQTQAHGGNIQVRTDPGGYPARVSQVEPGSTHDLTAARGHVLPALYPAAAAGPPTPTDEGYPGAGIGIQVPTNGDKPATANQTRNAIINTLRAPAERADALLKSTWRALRRVTPDPGESAPSPPPHSSYPNFKNPPGEKTSVQAEIINIG